MGNPFFKGTVISNKNKELYYSYNYILINYSIYITKQELLNILAKL